MIKLELLKEPLLEFGDDFLCDDPKKGIEIGGFYSKSHASHHSEIHYALMGSKRNMELFTEWIETLNQSIEASASETSRINNESAIIDGEITDTEQLDLFGEQLLTEDEINDLDTDEPTTNKKLNPDFPGFNKDSPFKSEFIHDELNRSRIREDAIEKILKSKKLSKFEKADGITLLLKEGFEFLVENFSTKPDICIVILPSNVFRQLSSIPFGKTHINFRRKLKAELISVSADIPIQIVLEDTLRETKKSLQDKSMIAWNFSVAQYYKTNSIPWSLTDIDKNSCFIGISFHKLIDPEKSLMRSSVAQAFNREGRGLVFVGKPFEWDKKTTKVAAPHLTYDYAKNLVGDIIKTYIAQNQGIRPNRVVVHKTTDFWNSAINADYSEVEGLKDGIHEILGESIDIDLVTIKNSDIKLLRENGKYPVMRGTYAEIGNDDAILYTTGYIPYFETFPGMHMPQPKLISLYEGETSIKNVCREILALTKMNFNNCNYYDSLPITLRFAQKVGEIIQYFPENEEFKPPNRYFFYM
ncbi:MAG: hypothetical protein RLQ12_09835 [Cyclobacteriaceae bacterium]